MKGLARRFRRENSGFEDVPNEELSRRELSKILGTEAAHASVEFGLELAEVVDGEAKHASET